MNKKNLMFIIRAVFVVATVICVTFGLTGCSNNSKDNDDISSDTMYLDKAQFEGYSLSTFSYTDGVMYVEYVSDDHKDFVLVKCEMSEKDCDKFFDIDSNEEDYDEQCLTFLSKYESVTTESLNDLIPDTEALKAYTGKTIADLEADGFEQTSAGNDDDGYIYLEYSNENYTYKVSTVQKYEALFDLEGVELQSLEIEEVTFFDFAYLDF